MSLSIQGPCRVHGFEIASRAAFRTQLRCVPCAAQQSPHLGKVLAPTVFVLICETCTTPAILIILSVHFHLGMQAVSETYSMFVLLQLIC